MKWFADDKKRILVRATVSIHRAVSDIAALNLFYEHSYDVNFGSRSAMAKLVKQQVGMSV